MTTNRPADPIRDGLSRRWRVFGGPHPPAPAVLECDVAIVGSGAGAGVTAELLALAGLQVVLVEEGHGRGTRCDVEEGLPAHIEAIREPGGPVRLHRIGDLRVSEERDRP